MAQDLIVLCVEQTQNKQRALGLKENTVSTLPWLVLVHGFAILSMILKSRTEALSKNISLT